MGHAQALTWAVMRFLAPRTVSSLSILSRSLLSLTASPFSHCLVPFTASETVLICSCSVLVGFVDGVLRA
jgi:hypothetical protein